MGLEPTTPSLGNAPRPAWLSQIRGAKPKRCRWEPLQPAPARCSLARNWRARCRPRDTATVTHRRADERSQAAPRGVKSASKRMAPRRRRDLLPCACAELEVDHSPPSPHHLVQHRLRLCRLERSEPERSQTGPNDFLLVYVRVTPRRRCQPRVCSPVANLTPAEWQQFVPGLPCLARPASCLRPIAEPRPGSEKPAARRCAGALVLTGSGAEPRYPLTCTNTMRFASPAVRLWRSQHDWTLPSIVVKRAGVPDSNMPTSFCPRRSSSRPSRSKPGRPASDQE